VLGAYGLARAIFGHNARALDARLDGLADRLVAFAQDAVASSSPSTG
jgi:hypothetical protein